MSNSENEGLVSYNYNKRTRAHCERTVRGVWTINATVEILDGTNEEVMEELKALIDMLKVEYPPEFSVKESK